jgi:hypothetical protein
LRTASRSRRRVWACSSAEAYLRIKFSSIPTFAKRGPKLESFWPRLIAAGALDCAEIGGRGGRRFGRFVKHAVAVAGALDRARGRGARLARYRGHGSAARNRHERGTSRPVPRPGWASAVGVDAA